MNSCSTAHTDVFNLFFFPPRPVDLAHQLVVAGVSFVFMYFLKGTYSVFIQFYSNLYGGYFFVS